MGREQRPGDWAAWLSDGSGAVSPREPAAAAVPAATAATAGPGPAPTPQPASDPPADPGAPSDLASDLVAPGPEGTPADAQRTPRREATRRRILDAAREVFAERGVIGGTVEDICEHAGFTRGAFYSNFADKDDVIDALVEREQNRLLDHLDVAFADIEREVAAAPDLATVLGPIIVRILRAVPIDRELSLVQAELENFAIRRPDLAGRFVAINQRFRERTAAFIEVAVRRNGRELLVDALLLTDALIAITQRSARRALLAGPGADPDELASAILPGLLLAFSRPVDGGGGP